MGSRIYAYHLVQPLQTWFHKNLDALKIDCQLVISGGDQVDLIFN